MSDFQERTFAEFVAGHEARSRAVREGLAARNRAGVPTGPVPLGYRKVRRDDNTVAVEIDEATALLVREAFRLAALKRQSLRKILARLAEQGLVSRRGKLLTPTSLSRVLCNPFYVGTVTYGGETAPGDHEALVSQGAFDKAQEQLSLRGRVNGTRK